MSTHLLCKHRMITCSLNHSPSFNHTNHSSDSSCRINCSNSEELTNRITRALVLKSSLAEPLTIEDFLLSFLVVPMNSFSPNALLLSDYLKTYFDCNCPRLIYLSLNRLTFTPHIRYITNKFRRFNPEQITKVLHPKSHLLPSKDRWSVQDF